MHRSLSICLALILATLSIATTGFAAEGGTLRFELSGASRDWLQLSLSRTLSANRTSGSSFEVTELAGVDRTALQGRDGSPVNFTLTREAGRLDCSGRTANRRATGSCRFTGNPAFASFLVASGIRQPTEGEAIDLTMVGANRSLVDALKRGRFVMPTPNTLVGMTALGVTPDYIAAMAAAGYRPSKTEDFLPLKALDVSPAYLGSLKRVGYDRVPVEEVIQLKALGITADFIANYQRHGFRDLSVSRLVQLKALGIRPEELKRQSSGRRTSLSAEQAAPVIMSGLLP
ncbi:hypothetical protein GGQ97_002414 [Sphingomonas kaistensis]|uniref:Uncharacterized protein n=1 Tax=Sphingomonas kaistensis TaxID=298708 RepID=A0A7X6BHZ2_9SPHN|nr:hypothetical protein [Sphingomonas kaistensis]NJC06621.1 hypothetical protein [Sphingomonas kaistensis]